MFQDMVVLAQSVRGSSKTLMPYSTWNVKFENRV